MGKNRNTGQKPDRKPGPNFNQTDGQPLEDRALKMGAALFGAELLKALGVEKKILRIAPTEQVYLNIKEFQEDFNFEMEDGSWFHFEFESDTVTVNDLRRFRLYESFISYQYQVSVTTYVICSARSKIGMDTLTEGCNTYRVNYIRLKNKDADMLIHSMEQEQQTSANSLSRSDLASLLFTPLMGGKMTIGERIEKSLRILQKERESLGKETLLQMEAVLYTLATKFLEKNELNQLWEVLNMTVLGQMLEQKGIEIGIARGMEQGIERGIEQGIIQGIEALILTCREFNASREETGLKIKSRFSLSDQEAEKYLAKYWSE